MKNIPILDFRKSKNEIRENLFDYISKLTPSSYEVRKRYDDEYRVHQKGDILVSKDGTIILKISCPIGHPKRVIVTMQPDRIIRGTDKRKVLLTQEDFVKFSFNYSKILSKAYQRHQRLIEKIEYIRRELINDIVDSFWARKNGIPYSFSLNKTLRMKVADKRGKLINRKFSIEACISMTSYSDTLIHYRISGSVVQNAGDLLLDSIHSGFTSEKRLIKYIEKKFSLKAIEKLLVV